MITRREAFERVIKDYPNFALAELAVSETPWRVYQNAPGSLRAILDRTAAFSDRPFLAYEAERWSYGAHMRIVAGLARQWAAWGVRKGDRVAIAMRNYPEWFMNFWAAMALGAVVVPLNAWWTADELVYGLGDAEVKLLVVDSERLERLADRTGETAVERIIAVRTAGKVPAHVVRWEVLLGDVDPAATLPEVDIEPEDDATIMYTSGTTGVPKGAIHSHRNHVTNLTNMAFSAAVTMATLGITPPDEPPPANILQTFPLFHIGGMSGLYSSTAFGANVFLQYKFDAAETADLIQRGAINSAAFVPTLYRRFLAYAAEQGLEFPSLAVIGSGGAPVPPDLVRQVQGQFRGRIGASNGYGLTETTSAVTLNSGAEYVEHPDSVGRLVPVADLRVVDPENGKELLPGRVGELWFRGPNVVRGYWNKPADTAAAFTDGWFHTGDLGYIDDEGLIYVVDRLKDVVIRSGENVYCAEVEAVLFEHPGVADVAVIGLPHESWGEEVVAIIEPSPGATLSVPDLQAHVKRRLASFKAPTTFHFTSEPLPRTATGKVLKRDLRQRFSPATS
jgi:long-chain acyl-CoA synthetase